MHSQMRGHTLNAMSTFFASSFDLYRPFFFYFLFAKKACMIRFRETATLSSRESRHENEKLCYIVAFQKAYRNTITFGIFFTIFQFIEEGVES